MSYFPCIVQRYNFRIYPTPEQEAQFKANADACRYVWNALLNYRSIMCRWAGRSASKYDCDKYITSLKRAFPWLKTADSMALQEASADLDQAFRHFFNDGAGYPVFKSAKAEAHAYSFRTRNQSNGIRIVKNKDSSVAGVPKGTSILIPKAGYVKIRLSRDIPGRILNVTIEKKPSGKWFVSVCFECEAPVMSSHGGIVGLDVGIKSFLADSNGVIVENPRCYSELERKLVREQRRLSRKKKGSKNYEKQRVKVALVHEKIANTRHDFLHKVSTTYANDNALIGIETLSIKNMMKNRHLSKSIADASWYSFVSMLKYKAKLRGNNVVCVSKTYPSSQTCHICGHKNPTTKDLSVRRYACPVCGTMLDRDINAAKNIRDEALHIYLAA